MWLIHVSFFPCNKIYASSTGIHAWASTVLREKTSLALITKWWKKCELPFGQTWVQILLCLLYRALGKLFHLLPKLRWITSNLLNCCVNLIFLKFKTETRSCNNAQHRTWHSYHSTDICSSNPSALSQSWPIRKKVKQRTIKTAIQAHSTIRSNYY